MSQAVCKNVCMPTHKPRRRLKAAESRRALLDAGIELLKSRGVAPGLDRVTLKDAIEGSSVARSTAYRLYEGEKGQLEEFRADLLADLDINSVETATTKADLVHVLAKVQPLIDSKDPVQLAQALREAVRLTVNATMATIASNLEWRVHMSSLASLGTGDADPALMAMLRAVDVDFGGHFADLAQSIPGIFGVRARAPLTMAQFGVVASAMAEGLALRQQVDARLANVDRSTGVGGQLQEWNAAAIAIEGLLLSYVEPDPDAEASADLTSWVR